MCGREVSWASPDSDVRILLLSRHSRQRNAFHTSFDNLRPTHNPRLLDRWLQRQRTTASMCSRTSKTQKPHRTTTPALPKKYRATSTTSAFNVALQSGCAFPLRLAPSRRSYITTQNTIFPNLHGPPQHGLATTDCRATTTACCCTRRGLAAGRRAGDCRAVPCGAAGALLRPRCPVRGPAVEGCVWCDVGCGLWALGCGLWAVGRSVL